MCSLHNSHTIVKKKIPGNGAIRIGFLFTKNASLNTKQERFAAIHLRKKKNREELKPHKTKDKMIKLKMSSHKFHIVLANIGKK